MRRKRKYLVRRFWLLMPCINGNIYLILILTKHWMLLKRFHLKKLTLPISVIQWASIMKYRKNSLRMFSWHMICCHLTLEGRRGRKNELKIINYKLKSEERRAECEEVRKRPARVRRRRSWQSLRKRNKTARIYKDCCILLSHNKLP